MTSLPFPIPFGLSMSFLPFGRVKDWDIVIENLCLYDGQDMAGILSSPVSRVLALNEASIKKAKMIAAQRKLAASRRRR